jgi:hypothetical protein
LLCPVIRPASIINMRLCDKLQRTNISESYISSRTEWWLGDIFISNVWIYTNLYLYIYHHNAKASTNKLA